MVESPRVISFKLQIIWAQLLFDIGVSQHLILLPQELIGSVAQLRRQLAVISLAIQLSFQLDLPNITFGNNQILYHIFVIKQILRILRITETLLHLYFIGMP